MTKLNYLEEDAALIVENLPEGFEATAETAPLFLIYAVLMRAKGIYTTLEDVHDAWAAWRTTTNPNHSDLVPFNSCGSPYPKQPNRKGVIMNPVLVISIVAIAISLTALGVSIGAHMAARDCRRVTVMFMTTVMEYLDGDSQVGVCVKKITGAAGADGGDKKPNDRVVKRLRDDHNR